MCINDVSRANRVLKNIRPYATVPTSAGGSIRKSKCAACQRAFWLKDKSHLVLGDKAARTQAEQREAHESLSVHGQVVSGVQKLYLNVGE